MSATTNTVLDVAPWLAMERGLASRRITVTKVLRTSAKAVQVEGHATIEGSDRCHRCGLEIRNPASLLVGYGPDCSAHLGIPRDFDEATLAAVKKAAEHESAFTAWLPRSAVALVRGEPLPDHKPTPEQSSTSLVIDGGRIVARTPFAVKDVCKSVNGARWDGTRKAWTFPVSESCAVELIDKLRTARGAGALTVAPEVEALAAQLVRTAKASVHKVADDDEVPPIELDPLGQPPWWIHQRRAFHFAREATAAGLFIGMGGGKSRVTVDLIRDRGDELVLIVCPKKVVGVWPKQFRLYAGEGYEVVAPRKGTVAKRAEEVRDALDRHRRRVEEGATTQQHRGVVVVVNYESAWREPLAKLLTATVWDRVVLDESHRIKAPGGKASRYCAQLGRVAKRRLCLTGTPMPHSPLDVYGQYRFLDPGVFGTSFARFRARYAVMGGYGGHEVLGYQRQDELASRTYSIAYRIADEELDAILGLEEPTHDVIDVELSPKARKHYGELWGNFTTDVGSGTVTVTNALTKLLRIQQVTSGHLPVEDEDGERHVEVLDTAKADALLDLIEDVDASQPVVVFCRFTHDLDNIERVAAELGRTYVELSGRRDDALTEDSTLVEHAQVAGVQMQAGGVGIDLTRSHYCVFYSVGFSLGDYDQALKRTHRPGQEHRVSYYHLVARSTIDEGVYAALRERKDVVDYVLGLAK